MTKNMKTIENQINQWEITREKGRKSYVVKNWILPLGFIFPLVSITVISKINNLPTKEYGVFLIVFEPIILIAVMLVGLQSWKYHEARYDRWKKEQLEGPLYKSGTVKEFEKYTQLLIGIYCIPVIVTDLLAFIPFLYISDKVGTSHHVDGIILIGFFSILILSFIPILNVMVFIKNPICGHGILSNPDHLHRHPDAKGNYWVNAWKILRNKQFMCLDCTDEYKLVKQDGRIDIIKVAKETI